jgi:glyoxylase-like metal-dependent hydrolase (beta-lactamase superfamily II)
MSVAVMSATIGVASAQQGQMPQFDMDQLRAERPLQQRTPVMAYTDRVQGEIWVKPSVKTKLDPGERVEIATMEDVDEVIIQRLTDRTYWVWANVYSLTMWVGDQGVLLIDVPLNFPVEQFLDKDIKRVTDLPVRAVVYSHVHVDHVGSAKAVADIMETRGIQLRVIASQSALDEVNAHKVNALRPNDVVPDGYATFDFEGQTFKHVTPMKVAHTGADSYTITPDGVAHVVDFFYPGILPLAQTSGVKDMTGYINFLRHLLGDEWTVANLGHNNVGYKADIETTFDYLNDLYNAAFEFWPGFEPAAMKQMADGGHNSGTMIRMLFDGVSTAMAEQMREKWSSYPHWELAWDHAHMVAWDFALNWDYDTARATGNKRAAMPDFTPIKPPE